MLMESTNTHMMETKVLTIYDSLLLHIHCPHGGRILSLGGLELQHDTTAAFAIFCANFYS